MSEMTMVSMAEGLERVDARDSADFSAKSGVGGREDEERDRERDEDEVVVHGGEYRTAGLRPLIKPWRAAIKKTSRILSRRCTYPKSSPFTEICGNCLEGGEASEKLVVR